VTLFLEVSGFLPRNRLAARMDPPGDASVFACFVGSTMNRLATMSFCQAARLSLWFSGALLDTGVMAIFGNRLVN